MPALTERNWFFTRHASDRLREQRVRICVVHHSEVMVRKVSDISLSRLSRDLPRVVAEGSSESNLPIGVECSDRQHL